MPLTNHSPSSIQAHYHPSPPTTMTHHHCHLVGVMVVLQGGCCGFVRMVSNHPNPDLFMPNPFLWVRAKSIPMEGFGWVACLAVRCPHLHCGTYHERLKVFVALGMALPCQHKILVGGFVWSEKHGSSLSSFGRSCSTLQCSWTGALLCFA